MTRERIVSAAPLSAEEEQINVTLRPEKLSEYIGQKQLVEKLTISLTAAKKRAE